MAKKPSKKKVTKTPRKGVHRSFKRTYREDYQRELEVPGIMQHVFESFKILAQNYKLFLPLLLISVLLGIFTVGTSGFFNETTGVFGTIIFLLIWLVTIFLLRHRLAGHKISLRDGLYNATTPLISTFVIFGVIVIQCIPIFILIIAYSAAVQTNFLATPFYGILFFGFAALMLAISGYLLSSSLMALLIVTVPGTYPVSALRSSAELMMSRRIKFIIRIVALIIVVGIIFAAVMLPLILLDVKLKAFAWAASIPFIPICFTIMSCFVAIYTTTYLYLYYRWVLDNEKK